MLKILLLLSFTKLSIACPSKKQSIECFYNIADTNSDGRITENELSKVISEYLPWWQWKAFELFGGTKRVIRDCDENLDGILTEKEAYDMDKTCLDSCFKRSAVEHVFNCK
jgi:Ca2+-binding EF-hand superfamily protein